MANSPPVVLTIAGFDPSSGAGVTADIKTLAAHGCFAVTCITALTVQSTTGVRRVEPVSARLVEEVLRELAADFPLAAVKIGMLANAALVEAVAAFLESANPPYVVLDPILRSTSGAELLDRQGIELLKKRLLSRATVITPNTAEAAALTGLPVTNREQMQAASSALLDLGAHAVVITGGELEKAIDVLSLSVAGGPPIQTDFTSDHLRSSATHGTGCAFASAIAANLALGKQLKDAVVLAKAYVTKAIARAYPLGKGTGPINHLYRMDEQPRPPQDVPETKH